MDLKRYWRKRTNLEKILISCVSILCFIVLVLFISFLVNNDNGICHSPQCVRSAVHLLDTIDPNVDPCDDFYQFACGTFIKKSFINKQPNSLHNLKELTKNQLKYIVTEKRNESLLPKTLVQQRKFYRTCLNTTAIEQDKNMPLLKVLDDIMGGWPIIKSYGWNDRDFEWTKSSVNARHAGVYYNFFFQIGVYPEFVNKRNVLWIRPPKGQEVDMLELKDENIERIANISKVLGAQSLAVTTELRRTMHFAEELDKIIQKYYNKTMEDDDTENYTKNMTIKEINLPHLVGDWVSFLNEISGLNITMDDKIIFTTETYLEDLQDLLQKTPKKVLGSYIGWAIIANSINFSTENIRNKFMEIKHVDNKNKENMDRLEMCYKVAKEFFKDVAEAEYVRRYTTKDKKTYIHDMLKRLKNELRASLEATTWMDEESRSNELKHLESISEAIGWTDQVYDVEKFDAMSNYKDLKFPSDSFFDMARVVNKATVDKTFLLIPRNWSTLDALLNSPIIDVNAFFVHALNILILPAPILQGHIFDEEKPRYINYGALGTVIGHELTHAFDGTLGLDSDTHYWTNQTKENFQNISECLKDEYEQYEENLKGYSKNESFGENLADFNGLHLAYRAYQGWVATYGHEKSLPGIKYTPNQIFWLMTSTYMCFEPEKASADKFNRGHGIPSFRVVGRLRNSEEFARDFNCPEGSKMNPKNKCKIYP